MAQQPEHFVIKCTKIDRETDKAILVHVDLDEHALPKAETWFPLSQVHEIHRDDEAPRIVVTPWIAKLKGLL